MSVRCSWCQPAPSTVDLNISHGICEDCQAKLLRETADLDPLKSLQRQVAELSEVVTALIEGGIEVEAAR